MISSPVAPPKSHLGDKIAVLSASFAAPGAAPAVHEQAIRRLTQITGLIPVEYPTTRQLGSANGVRNNHRSQQPQRDDQQPDRAPVRHRTQLGLPGSRRRS